MELIAIDPRGCGCTSCITGESVPLDDATPEQIAAMLMGSVRNNSGTGLRVTFVVEDGHDIYSPLTNVEVVSEDFERRTWAIDPLLLAVAR